MKATEAEIPYFSIGQATRTLDPAFPAMQL